MDAGAIGAFIGIGIMGCVLCTVCLYDNHKKIQRRFKRETQSLLPVVIAQNTILPRKQFQMRYLLHKKYETRR
jgi:hypothetical protein